MLPRLLVAVLLVTPVSALADTPAAPPTVSAKGWAVADGTGRVIAGSHEAEPRPIASTTKIMTAWLVFRLADADPKALDGVVTYSERAAKAIGSSAKLKAGERVS